MKFNLSSTWRGVLLAAALLSSASAGDLLIGQVAPLSGSIASTGQRMVQGAQLWFDHVNELGGIHGAHIRQVIRDDGYQVDKTVEETRELVADDQVLALIGFAGTANIAELLKRRVLEEAGITLIAPYTGGAPLRTPYNPSIFHIRAGYADEAEHLVKQLTTLGYDRIGVLYQDDAFGKSGLDGVLTALAKRKLQPLLAAGYPRNTAEVQPAVDAMLKAQPSAIIMVAVNKPAAAFAKAYRAAGGGAQLTNISVVDPIELIKLAGIESVRGLGISQVMPYPYNPTLPVVKEYLALLKQHGNGAEPSYTTFEEFIGAKVLTEALRRAGPNPSRGKVSSALASLRNYDVGGFQVDFGERNRQGSRFVEVTVIGADGRLLR